MTTPYSSLPAMDFQEGVSGCNASSPGVGVAHYRSMNRKKRLSCKMNACRRIRYSVQNHMYLRLFAAKKHVSSIFFSSLLLHGLIFSEPATVLMVE
jgi:hypothetical protein